MELVSNHKLNTRSKFTVAEGTGAPYKRDIYVTQFGKDGKHKHHYHFLGAFPTSLSAIALDWGTASEIEEYTCTWTYDRWMPGTSAKGPLTTVDHLLSTEKHTA